VGSFGIGGGERFAGVAGVAGVDGVVEEAGFDGRGAAQTPEGGGHFLVEAEFDVAGGAVAADVLSQKDVEVLSALGAQNDATGEQVVADGVEGRGLFSGGCSGASRANAVGAGRKDSFEGRHSIFCSKNRPGVAGGTPDRVSEK